jgi:hypothetical protein
MGSILDEIERFKAAHQMSDGRFGELALCDRKLVANIRHGRSPSLDTAARIREFMVTYPNHTAYVPRTRRVAA